MILCYPIDLAVIPDLRPLGADVNFKNPGIQTDACISVIMTNTFTGYWLLKPNAPVQSAK